jgi:hypothetical protein
MMSMETAKSRHTLDSIGSCCMVFDSLYLQRDSQGAFLIAVKQGKAAGSCGRLLVGKVGSSDPLRCPLAESAQNSSLGTPGPSNSYSVSEVTEYRVDKPSGLSRRSRRPALDEAGGRLQEQEEA